MASNDSGTKAGRRQFLTGVIAAGAASAIAPSNAAAADAPAPARLPSALPPSGKVAAAESATPQELARVKGIP
ncbi:MAG: 2-oxoglutarate dehydrogenase, E2 component, dihydrolipoamide succinyltransferase, partial [Proteobacteria bacterium]|nr:2-oxoglutarate dehydrogenase, E2 component, dihydrolipoamide succinyltransferase [Pseudomonadota bacterium]